MQCKSFYSKGKIYIEYINIFLVITNVITLKVETQKKVDMIKVEIEGYYNRPEFYPYMPKEIFDKLEAAAMQGEDLAELPRELFEKMVEDFESQKK